MNKYSFHISLYDLGFEGTIFIGLTFALLLWFAQSVNRPAKRFLSLALVVMALWMIRLWGTDIGIGTYYPRWGRLPLQFSLAFGPVIFFYVLRLTRPGVKFRWKHLLHFSPLLFELSVQLLAANESVGTGAGTYDTRIFQQLSPYLHLLAFISVAIYLYWSHLLIGRFYRRLKFTGGDRYLTELRWLHRLLAGFGLLWLLWVPFTAIDYFYYDYQLSAQACYPLYLLLASMITWMAARAFLRPEISLASVAVPALKPLLPMELKQKGFWLKNIVKEKRYYEDPELSLSSLAEKLGLTTHELSGIINTALKKNFNDFINEYRVRDVASKMQDPGYSRITLLGMALDAGFNSKATFIRAFKQLTGKNPAAYKLELEKEVSTYHLQPHSQTRQIIFTS